MMPYSSILAAGFSDTINLGAVVVGLLIVVLYGLSTWRDKKGERWKELYELADVERKEIRDQLQESTRICSEQREMIAKLDALQMPVKIVELMNASVERIDKSAQKRLEESVGAWRKDREQQEKLDRERHDALYAVLNELKGLLLRINGRT